MRLAQGCTAVFTGSVDGTTLDVIRDPAAATGTISVDLAAAQNGCKALHGNTPDGARSERALKSAGGRPEPQQLWPAGRLGLAASLSALRGMSGCRGGSSSRQDQRLCDQG